MIKEMWYEVKGDFKKLVGWVLVAVLSSLSLTFIPWGASGGDMLSALAFVFTWILVLVHVLRRLLLPQVQLMAVMRKACEDSLGAAIVFFSTVLLFCVLTYCFILLWIK